MPAPTALVGTSRRLATLWARGGRRRWPRPPSRRTTASSSSSEAQPGAPAPPPPGTNVTAPELMTPALYSYLLAHTRESEVLARLRADTAAFAPGRDRNMVSVDTGALLAWLVGATGARRAVEVGVFTGYSSTALAAALPPDGTLLALEKDERPLALARAAWAAAGVADRVDARVGDARETLASLLADPASHGAYDFAFIDADKRGYDAYYEACLQLVRRGGVVAIDNLLWYGRVADAADASPATEAVRALNAKLVADERIEFVLAPVGDGVGLCRKK